ncbi:MAG: copper chaperone PCu(A)C [Beijerinckiaceae bacterium]
MVSKSEIAAAVALSALALLFTQHPAAAQAANPHAGHTMPTAPAATNPVAKSWMVGAMKVESVWTRATPGGAKVAGGYVTITNTGKEPDRLVKFDTPVAGHGEIHEMVMAEGVMKMRELKGLDIKPGEMLVLKPGGLHLMFMDLKQPLVQGAALKGTLTFEKAGPVEVDIIIAPIGAASAGSAHKH